MIFLWPVRVYYEDTDSGGVVYYANYLKFLERARTEWLRTLGYEQDRLIAEQQLIFAVRHVGLEYLAPARFNEQLYACAQVAEHKGASITFKQQVVRFGKTEPAEEFVARQMEAGAFSDVEKQVLCDGRIQIVCLDSERMRPRRIPEELTDMLLAENRL